MNNVIFYFSGTGNSLYAAKTVAAELGNTEIVSMSKPGGYALKTHYDSAGFVYPVYFWGLPKKVIEFVTNMDFGNNKDAYYYAIATYGGSAGNALNQLYELLQKRHNITLNYARTVKMFSNYVVMYDMDKRVQEITKKSGKNLIPVINAIKARENNSVNRLAKVCGFVNKNFIRGVTAMDKDYVIDENCTGCGICGEVCPVKNIEMINNKPQFNHACENCVACIQFCPQKALNYKNATQNRGRYTHPGISWQELSERNKQ